MRNRLPLLLILSLTVHILIIGFVHFKQPEKKKAKPIEVSIVPKDKTEDVPQTPSHSVRKPAASPDDYGNMDEELETDIKQPRQAIKKYDKKKGKAGKQTDVKNKGNLIPAPVPLLPAENNGSKNADLPKVAPDAERKKVNEQAEKDRINNILNPTDIIKKYAEGGPDVTGEDSVSMQYVKLKYQSYFHKFARRLYQVWQYPVSAAMRGESGIVQASFSVSRDGKISSIRIINSSGYPDLDNEVMYALKKMSGVPLPESYSLDSLTVDAYFMYILGGGFVVY